MNILIVSATQFEILPVLNHLQKHFTASPKRPLLFSNDALHIQLLITGVGLTHTAFELGNYLTLHRPDLVINVGIAGSFRRDWALGAVVQVGSERFADVGVEEADGRFTDVFEMGLIELNTSPYINGKLYNPNTSAFAFLPIADGISVNRVHGTAASVAAIQTKYNPDIETMEGAAFFYACLSANVSNFVAIRGISNYVEARKREAWNIPAAIEQSNQVLLEMLDVLQQSDERTS